MICNRPVMSAIMEVQVTNCHIHRQGNHTYLRMMSVQHCICLCFFKGQFPKPAAKQPLVMYWHKSFAHRIQIRLCQWTRHRFAPEEVASNQKSQVWKKIWFIMIKRLLPLCLIINIPESDSGLGRPTCEGDLMEASSPNHPVSRSQNSLYFHIIYYVSVNWSPHLPIRNYLTKQDVGRVWNNAENIDVLLILYRVHLT